MKRAIKFNISLFSLILFSIIFLSINFVSALELGTQDVVNVTIVVNQLNNDGIINLNANTTINISIRAPAESNWTRVKDVYLISLGATANNTLLLVRNGNDANVTSSNSGITYNISIAINHSAVFVEDGNDYNLTIVLFNVTKTTNVSRLITIDHGAPLAATSLLPASDTDGTVNFSATVTGSNATRCYLNFTNTNPGSISYLMINDSTTDSCSISIANIPEQSYGWFITTSDGTNATRSALQTTNVDTTSGGARGAQYLLEEEETGTLGKVLGGDKPNTTAVIVIVIIIVLTVLWFRRM